MSPHKVWKGLSAGLIGGLAGSLAMNRFQELLSRLESSAGDSGGSGGSGGEAATVKAAESIAQAITGHELSAGAKSGAGNAMHYAMGATSGAIYGMLATRAPVVTAGAGAAFGAVLWAVADEGAVAALGLSKGPLEYPAPVHLKALASHVVYGITAELVRRATARII